MCADYYLYNFLINPSQILIKSSESYKLMNQFYFTGNLDNLNKLANEIIYNYIIKNNLIQKNSSGPDDIDTLRNIKKIKRNKNNEIKDHDYIIINGQKIFCGMTIDK